MHKSRISCYVFDCQAEDLAAATAFWSAALGRKAIVDDPPYAVLDDVPGEPRVLLQTVTHEPRIHLDIETDDQEAEVARLEALGAERLKDVKSWTVMRAPTGHVFCVVKPQRPDFATAEMATWEDPVV